MNTGELIKKLRKEKKMSQDQLAKLLGYSGKSAISKLEKGGFELSQDKLVLFANYFGISVDSLVNNEISDTNEKVALINVKALYGQGAIDIIDSYNRLNETGKKKAVEAVADLADIDRYKK